MKNTYIVIPALKPGPGLAGEIRELGRRLCARIVLVDDGSARITRRHFPWQRGWRLPGPSSQEEPGERSGAEDRVCLY